MPPPVPTIFLPYMPPITPYRLPPAAFELLIQKNGLRLLWMKSHACPCVQGNYTAPGSPDTQCQTCHGRGVYWDQPVGPFMGLITFIHTSPTPDEPGAIVDENPGLMLNGEPTLTLGYSLQPTVWQLAGLYDMYVEADALSRLQVTLQKGFQESIPYQQALSVAATGAVTVYDTTNHVVVSGVPYVVSGTTVTLGSGFASGTAYVVDFIAAPAYVAYRVAGAPAHIRPFAESTASGAGLAEPRRFRLQQLDMWTRAKFPGDVPIVPPGT